VVEGKLDRQARKVNVSTSAGVSLFDAGVRRLPTASALPSAGEPDHAAVKGKKENRPPIWGKTKKYSIAVVITAIPIRQTCKS
jgi:hypothetical protein